MKSYFKKIWKTLLVGGVCLLLVAGVFSLYDLPLEPVAYAAVLCALACLAALGYGYYRYSARRKHLSYILETLPLNLDTLPEPGEETEALYQEMLARLNEERMKAQTQRQRFYSETTDYYTMWVHQIKTPISALRLLLSEHEDENRESLGELLRVEQYVEMVLGYLRLESTSTDFVFQNCDLDGMIRQAIRKYAPLFVRKRIRLVYEPVNMEVLTDEKWFLFILQQILSNAVKYTDQGSITITAGANKVLRIKDTGMGIAKEDLPRIFDHGFTGYNGRADKKATGLGLYLCRLTAKRLSHKITVTSEIGKGTEVSIDFNTIKLDCE